MHRSLFRQIAANFAKGLAMGAADVVPGVSGGTMALLVGIYDRLVQALAHLSAAATSLLRGGLRQDFAAARQAGARCRAWWVLRERLRRGFAIAQQAEWPFLSALGAGIAVAVLALVELVRLGIDDYPVATSSAFFGLVAGAVVTTRRAVPRWTASLLAVFVLVALAVFALVGVRTASASDPTLWAVFGAGALASCAMILPGISGAFVLVLLGLYDPVTAAVSERDLAVVTSFGLGAMVGLGTFVRVLRALLERWRDLMVAAMMGLMTGSLRVLWPWPATGGEGFGSAALGAPVASDLAPAIGAAVLAAALGLALGRLGNREARG